jgi:hypothetical protein
MHDSGLRCCCSRSLLTPGLCMPAACVTRWVTTRARQMWCAHPLMGPWWLSQTTWGGCCWRMQHRWCWCAFGRWVGDAILPPPDHGRLLLHQDISVGCNRLLVLGHGKCQPSRRQPPMQLQPPHHSMRGCLAWATGGCAAAAAACNAFGTVTKQALPYPPSVACRATVTLSVAGQRRLRGTPGSTTGWSWCCMHLSGKYWRCGPRGTPSASLL